MHIIGAVLSVLLGIYFTTTHPNTLSVAMGTEREPYVGSSLGVFTLNARSSPDSTNAHSDTVARSHY